MSNRRHNNYNTTSSSSSSPTSDFTTSKTKNNISEETNDESDTFNRPLSLYDNLNALVASLKPPGICENKFIENYNKNLINNNKNSGGTVNHNINNNRSDLLFNVNQEDFIFSDIKFNFPRIPNNYSIIDSNNDSDRAVNLKNGTKNNMISNNSQHHHHHYNNNSNNHNKQYANLDDTVGNKPVHSDAKSSFFGLNNGIHNTRNSFNNNDTPPPTTSQQLHSMPNADDGNDVHDDDDDDDNTLITITNVQSTTINIQKRKNVNSNEDVGDGGGGDDNNNNNGDDSNECDEQKNFLNSSESQQKQVTYITPDKKYGYDNKPSQAVYMATTVPQNIKGNNIMGRHTPTRNSLRHSRMLVVNKHFQGGFEKSNPMNLQCPGLLRLLLIIALLSGILLTSLALWIQVWAPNTRIQDKPYWSGIVLILCSIISLKLLNFKRAARNNFRKICFKVLKINSIIFSVAAIILTFVAFVFAVIHFKNLWYVDEHCIPSKLFTATSECLCIFGVSADYGGDRMKIQNPENLEIPMGGYTFHYKDLSCSEVRDAWRYIVLASLIINLIGFLAIGLYLFIFFFKTKKRKQPNITVNRMSSINIT